MHRSLPKPALFVVIALAGLSAAPALLAAGAVLHKGGPVAITADGSTVWTVLEDHDVVVAIDTLTLAVTQYALPAAAAPHRPKGIAVAPDGTAWVAAHDSSRVFVLDGATGLVLAEVLFGAGAGPVSVAIAPSGQTAWVALHRSAEVAVIDVATRTLLDRITGLFKRPLGLAFDETGTDLWVTHTIMDGEDSHVTAIEAATHEVAARVILKSVNPKEPAQISGDPDPIPEGGYLLLRGQLAPRPGTSKIWLPVQYQNFHNPVFTSDSTVQAAIHRLDAATRTNASGDRVVLSAVYAHQNTTLVGDGWNAGIAGPTDLAFSADGQMAYLVNQHSDDVLVFPADLAFSRPVGATNLPEVPVGSRPLGIVASPIDDRLFVLNALSRDLSVIDASVPLETARIPLDTGLVEPLSPDFLLGAVLFHTSTDPRLSDNGKISCASCHADGETDGLIWSFAQFGAGNRKTLNLRGFGLTMGPPIGGLGQLHRGGDRDEVQDFEWTARGAVMGGTGFLSVPNPELGAPNAGLDADLDALATYVTDLAPIDQSPERADDGTLSDAARRGAKIFQNPAGTPFGAGCAGCHTPPAFTDLDFHDVGGHAPSPENQGPAFNTPTLVGAWDTGPYVQVVAWVFGGSLLGVVEAATGVHGNAGALSASQKRDLAAFLRSIDGQMLTDGLTGVSDTTPPKIIAVKPIRADSVEVIFDEHVDPVTAGNPANYQFDGPGGLISATSATLDTGAGNRVRIIAPLPFSGCPITYTLVPGPIEDVAAQYGAPANHVLDPSDPAHTLDFTLDGTITVTFGDVTGLETFPGVAQTASFNPGLGNVSHDHWRLYPTTSPETKGFVRFDFPGLLASECGVTDASEIVGARFTANPFYGNRNTLELRRVLMPWGEPPNDWCFGCGGTVTRQNATHPSIPWHQSGAGAIGGSGTSVSEYYPSANFDLTATVDATVTVLSMVAPVEFASPSVTDAFRFWFENPSVNFGHSVEVVGNQGVGTEFQSASADLGRNGVTLEITFAVTPTAGPSPDCNGNGVADSCDIDTGTSQDVDSDGVPDECQGPGVDFIRGDCNTDGGIDISDVVRLLGTLFSGANPFDCPEACENNDDGALDIADAIFVLNWLFSSGPNLPPPSPACGADPNPPGPGCPSFGGCP